MLAALAVAAALPAMVAVEIVHGLRLEAAVRELRDMDVAQLGRAYEDSPFKRDRYFLGVLARLAALGDADLYEPMGSLWDVMGENRKGLAVMRLVARHPNTDAATLAKLAAEPDAQRVVHELAANPKTPMPVLERLATDADESVARNAKQAIERRRSGVEGKG